MNQGINERVNKCKKRTANTPNEIFFQDMGRGREREQMNKYDYAIQFMQCNAMLAQFYSILACFIPPTL